MSPFTDAEQNYLDNQRLGRLATLASDGAPQTRPVGFTLNHDLGTIDIGGSNMASSQKYRNIQRDPRVSFVVDDLASIKPWRPRGIEVRGTAELVNAETARPGYAPELIRIHPFRILAWGLDTSGFAAPNSRNVKDPA